MDSITRSSFTESSGCSNRSARLGQVNPDSGQQAESGVDRAKSMPDVNAGLPTQTSITDRVVTASDASAANPGGAISQTKPADFSVLYPRLDQLINDLLFISTDDLGRFAFACGLYSEYCQIRRDTKGLANGKAAFFRKYFEIEGSDAGIKKFQLFRSCGIFYKPQQDKLDSVLEKNVEVESLPGTQVKTVYPDFDFQLAFEHVANKMGTLNDAFVFKLGFKDDAELADLDSQRPGEESRSKTMIVLQAFAQRGGRTVDLLKPLEYGDRTDLKQKLEKALDEKVVDLSAGYAPQKVKYDSGQ